MVILMVITLGAFIWRVTHRPAPIPPYRLLSPTGEVLGVAYNAYEAVEVGVWLITNEPVEYVDLVNRGNVMLQRFKKENADEFAILAILKDMRL